jgi:hypothetical protein
METQRPVLLFFWIAMFAPTRAGVTLPEKRTVRPRLTRRLLTFVLTYCLTPSVTIGLTICGRSGICTRYCVLNGTDASGKAKPPCALVICGLAALMKPWV